MAQQNGAMPPEDDSPLLTPQQERFAQEYLIDLNATQAAIRAGYSKKSAAAAGSRLLTISKIESRIALLMSERAMRTQITQDRVLTELAALAFTSFTELASWDTDTIHFVPSDDLAESAKRTVKSIKTKRTTRTEKDAETVTVEMEISQHDKLSALDKIMKNLGMYRPDEGTGRTSGLDALVELMAARKRQRDSEREGADEG